MTAEPGEPTSHGREYPPLEGFGSPTDPYAPIDYPATYLPPPPPYPPPYQQSYPPYQGYPADPYDYRSAGPARPPGTNGKAIGSLVASLVGLMFCGLPSIAGVMLGVIAMRETKRTGQDGHGMALAGTIVGGIVAAVWLVFLLTWLLGVILALNSSTYS